MSVFSISDLHLSFKTPKPMDIFGGNWDGYLDKIEKDWCERVGEDDIVLLSGDLSWAMYIEDAMPDIEWVSKMPGYKIILRGNHDYWWKSIKNLRELLPQKMYALQNDCMRIGKYLFCGTRGWALPEGMKETPEDIKIYKREGERLKLSLEAMRKERKNGDEVIAMFHYPPFSNRLAPTVLTDMITDAGITKVVYGHLHGKIRISPIVEIYGTEYHMTSCDLTDNKLVKICD